MALPEVGPWAIAGYQCDIHPGLEPRGMTCEQRGSGIFGFNGMNVAFDPGRRRWLIGRQDPVKVDVSQWNEYTVIALGNQYGDAEI